MINLFDKKGNCHPRNHCYKVNDVQNGKLVKEIGFRPTGIAYDNDNDVFYLTHIIKGDKKKGEKDKYVVSVFKLKEGHASPVNDRKNFDLKLSGLPGYVPQGITYNEDKKTLYVALWEANGKVDGFDQKFTGPDNSLVVAYKVNVDKKGNFSFDKGEHIRFDHDKKNNTKFEIEGICFENNKGNTLYMAVNADSVKNKNTDAIYNYEWK